MTGLVDGLEQAIGLWREALGFDAVVTNPQFLKEAQTATFSTAQRITAILSPATKDEVQQCLRIANAAKVPLYPISSGKNWGYGSRVPPVDQCAILSLARLNRIVDYNDELGYVTVEPGVTQRQLYTFLQQSKSRFWMDATGSAVDTSLIGNIMERGFGHTPLGDRFAHVCGLEVILPSGAIIETGSARFLNSLTAPVSRWGVGPSLDGLFSQSNLGVVVRMTIWLMPAPPYFEAYFFRVEDKESLPELIDALRELRLRDILRSSIHIGNDYKVLAGLRQYPWTETGGVTPLSPHLMGGYRRQLGFGSWNVSGALYGTKAQVAESKKLLKRELKRVKGSAKFLSMRRLKLAKRFAKPFRLISGWDLRRTVELVEPLLGLMQGIPTNYSLGSAYWRKKITVPHDADPDRDKCGLLWYAPVSPAIGSKVQQLTEMMEQVLLKYGFEPQISLTLLTPRAVSCIVSICYDRDVPEEDEKAHACYLEAARLCTARGYFPYRLSIIQNDRLPENPAYTATLQALKTALDPNRILAPGRYEPTPQF